MDIMDILDTLGIFLEIFLTLESESAVETLGFVKSLKQLSLTFPTGKVSGMRPSGSDVCTASCLDVRLKY